VQVVYELAPLIATIISAHCPGTRARDDFVRACMHGDWEEAECMIEGMLAEPWHLRGHQETRLREFLGLLQFNRGLVVGTVPMWKPKGSSPKPKPAFPVSVTVLSLP